MCRHCPLQRSSTTSNPISNNSVRDLRPVRRSGRVGECCGGAGRDVGVQRWRRQGRWACPVWSSHPPSRWGNTIGGSEVVLSGPAFVDQSNVDIIVVRSGGRGSRTAPARDSARIANNIDTMTLLKELPRHTGVLISQTSYSQLDRGSTTSHEGNRRGDCYAVIRSCKQRAFSRSRAGRTRWIQCIQ